MFENQIHFDVTIQSTAGDDFIIISDDFEAFETLKVCWTVNVENTGTVPLELDVGDDCSSVIDTGTPTPINDTSPDSDIFRQIVNVENQTYLNDTIQGTTGIDRVFGGAGLDTLNGGAGNDLLHGNSGKDVLVGGNGDDFLGGNSGKDVLVSGNGDDFLGGTGVDFFESGNGQESPINAKPDGFISVNDTGTLTPVGNTSPDSDTRAIVSAKSGRDFIRINDTGTPTDDDIYLLTFDGDDTPTFSASVDEIFTTGFVSCFGGVTLTPVINRSSDSDTGLLLSSSDDTGIFTTDIDIDGISVSFIGGVTLIVVNNTSPNDELDNGINADGGNIRSSDHVLSQLTQPGNIIRLTTPTEILPFRVRSAKHGTTQSIDARHNHLAIKPLPTALANKRHSVKVTPTI